MYRNSNNFNTFILSLTSQRALAFSLLLVGALAAFEIFNFSTTEFAMNDLLGDLQFAGMRWSTILALAFCGIDFAGIARLFTPEQGSDEPAEIWYLFGAWLLAALMNASLTWWGVSIAILHHNSLGSAVISRQTLLRGVPIFVALMVLLSRVLIIGTFSVAGEKLFLPVSTQAVRKTSTRKSRSRTLTQRASQQSMNQPGVSYASSYRPAPKPRSFPPEESYDQMPMIARGEDKQYRGSYYR
jgi:hypothetical protein